MGKEALAPGRARSTGRLFTGSLLSTAATNVTAAALAVITGVLAARLLGPHGRGELAAILNWPLFLSAVGSLGVMTATAYYCGREPLQASRTFATAWVFLVVLSFPIMGLGYWLMPWLLRAQTAGTIESARVVLLLVVIQFVGALPYSALQGLGKFTIWNVVRLQMPILWVAVLLICAYLPNRSAAWVSYGFVLAMTVHCLTWTVAMSRAVPGPYRPDFSRLSGLVSYGLLSMFSGFSQQLNQRLDQLLMAAFLPAQTLGLYVVAVAWSGALSPLLTSVAQVIFPTLAGLHDRRAQTETLQRTLRLSVLAAAVLTAGLLTVTPVLLPLLFGTAFAPAIPAAIVLVLAAGVASLSQVASEALRGFGAPKYPVVAEFVGLAFTVPLLVMLLPRFQLMGAAIVSLVSYSATFITLLLLMAREFSVSPWALLLIKRQEVSLLWGHLPKWVLGGLSRS